MCGIAGFVAPGAAGRQDLASTVRRMAAAVEYRGPDGSAEWIEPASGVALAHRRLAILDPSAAGGQPMISASGRYVIVHNGEVYNFRELRKDLASDGIAWRGSSDTEVVLAAIDAWGLDRAVSRFAGMFAFALWDRQDKTLHLVRDRLGIKPLCYGWVGGAFLFGSVPGVLAAHPSFDRPVCRDALAMYLRQGHVPAPHTIHAGVYKLLPGHRLSLRLEDAARPDSARSTAYWSATDAVECGRAERESGREEGRIDELEALIEETVTAQLVADVPLGALLSGGIDSSLVVALMQKRSARPVKTFTIGFHEAAYDEARQAAAVARHLGTEHTELVLSPRQAMDVIPRLPRLYDEPFADASQIPTLLVCELARRDVTVALSGDGGDELFGGYNRHVWGRWLWNRMERTPRTVRRMLARGLGSFSPRSWDAAFAALGPILPARLRQRLPGEKMHKLAAVLALDAPDAMYGRLASIREDPAGLLAEPVGAPALGTDTRDWPHLSDFTERMMFQDLVGYLPDGVLVKTDRASMGVSLEARVPLLDHRVVELAWRLPLSLKIRDGQTKWILRQILQRHVPRALVERPKMGFGVPIDDWLRGPLADWAESLLDEARLRREGLLNAGAVRREWDEHRSGRENLQHALWSVLMFQSWLETREKQGSSLDIGHPAARTG